MSFTQTFLQTCIEVINKIDTASVEHAAEVLSKVRDNEGRLFLVGSGGGAGHSSHAACDFRKLCNIQAYAPYDNVSELTARVNDEGWDTTLSNWLKVSRLKPNDCVFVFSVGGGNEQAQISMNLVNAVKYAKTVGATVAGIVSKDGGYTRAVGDAVILVPNVAGGHVTPLAEGFQALLWHLLVSHPLLQVNAAKWESVTAVV